MSYQSAEDDDDTHTSAPVFGPFLPSCDTPSTGSSDQPSTVGRGDSPKKKIDEKSDKKTEDVKRKGDEFDKEIQQLKAIHDKYQKRAQKKKQSTAKDSDTVDVEPPAASTSTEVSSKPTQVVENIAEVVEIEVREETCEATDDQTFVRSEPAGRHREGEVVGPAPPAVEDAELDVEDIDKQLELALARHKVSLTVAVCLKFGTHYPCVRSGFMDGCPHYLWTLDTAREHGSVDRCPCSQVSKTSTVNTGACPHYP